MPRLPSTQALRALECFARHGTVWQAADELALTRSAVSHQLRLLERDLGFCLLNRVGTRIELTAQGKGYAQDVRRALTAISGAAARHAGRGVSGALTVSCPPGFAATWLCTKLGGFHTACPDVDLSLVTPRRLDDVSNPNVDVFIAFGLANSQSALKVQLLKEVEFTPLCSPVLLNRLGGLAGPADLARATLLHLTDRSDWAEWFRLAGLSADSAQGGIVFSDMNLAYAAVLAAQGVTMGDEFICHQAMESGQLVRPFDLAIKSARSYLLVVPPEKSGSPAVTAFCDWLFAELPGQAA